MTPQDARSIIRGRGMCGNVDIEANRICILDIGHDDHVHEQKPWRVEIWVEPDPNDCDSRRSVSNPEVTNGTMRFRAQTEAQAYWLCDLLNEDQNRP